MNSNLPLSGHAAPPGIYRYFFDDTCAAQCARLLDTLRLGPIDAVEARERLEVFAPQERIRDLRLLGHKIQTRLVWAIVDVDGETRRKCVPEYRLLLGQCHPRHNHAGSPP